MYPYYNLAGFSLCGFTLAVQGRGHKSGKGGVAVLFDTPRIRKGVLDPQPLVCVCHGLKRGCWSYCAKHYTTASILYMLYDTN